MRPLGPVVCISPWNFPLAIFTGQVAAALAAGNTVLAKPAEETPLIAAEAVRLLHEAGVPTDVLRLLPGDGAVGAALVGDARVQGVMFTGSNRGGAIDPAAIGRPIDRSRSTRAADRRNRRIECLVADSSALAEQVVADVIASAFDSGGQRCSALRILCLQEDVADAVLGMLKGAMQELRIGNPTRLDVDIGPVITADARDSIEAAYRRDARPWPCRDDVRPACRKPSMAASSRRRSSRSAASPTSSGRFSVPCCTWCDIAVRISTRWSARSMRLVMA